MSEILQIINRSPGDLAPVFDAVIEHSMRLCHATQGHLYIYADGQIHAEALRGEPHFVEWQRRRGSHPVTRGARRNARCMASRSSISPMQRK
jgi:hypothetical protein